MRHSVKYDDVQVMLADPRTHIRSALKVALTHAGLENVEHTGTIDIVSESIQHTIGPDILICDMDLDDGDICDMITNVRHNDLGRNPFLCVIGLTWKPQAKDIVRMINSGIDHLVRAPMSPQQILTRIRSLIHHRQPFIVTADYVGPDRRKQMRGRQKIPAFDVPNALRAKALGFWDPREFERELLAAVSAINTRKIGRQAEMIASLSELILTLGQREDGAVMIRPHIERLNRLVNEMERRARDYGFSHVSELCKACVGVVLEMKVNTGVPPRRDLELLNHLGMAIKGALYPVEEMREITNDIVATVQGR